MSKVIAYIAVSEDGFIAGDNDDVDWVGEASWNSYSEFVKTCDKILVGKNTFDLMTSEEFEDDTDYLVITRQTKLNAGKYKTLSIHSKDDLPKGNKIGVIGGANLINELLKLKAIDEIIIDNEAIKLGKGIKLFDDEPKLELLSTNKIGPKTIQKHYKVIY